MDAISGLDGEIVDGGTDQLDPGLEMNFLNAEINLPVYASQNLPLDIGITASTLPFAVNPPPTQRAFEGYSLLKDPPPNSQIDFGEVARQREISEKQRLASSWNKVANYVGAETQQLRTCLYLNWDPVAVRKMVDSLKLLGNPLRPRTQSTCQVYRKGSACNNLSKGLSPSKSQ